MVVPFICLGAVLCLKWNANANGRQEWSLCIVNCELGRDYKHDGYLLFMALRIAIGHEERTERHCIGIERKRETAMAQEGSKERSGAMDGWRSEAEIT